MFLSDQCPLVIIEVCPKGNEADRPRMLLQGSLLVRALNSIKPTGFAIICSYGDLPQQRVCRESIPHLSTRQDGYRGAHY